MVPIRILEDLCTSDIPFSIICLGKAGFDVRLGDEMEGWKEINNFADITEAILWLKGAAIRSYPHSYFAVKYLPLDDYPLITLAGSKVSGSTRK
jgi:hypothetical protein